MPSVRSHNEYTLYIRLAEIEPAIWRRIVAPGCKFHLKTCGEKDENSSYEPTSNGCEKTFRVL